MSVLPVVNRLDSLFSPRQVAIIGVSAKRRDAGGNCVLRNLQRSNYSGEIFAVNPAGGMIEGISALTAVDQLPAVDLAVVALGPKAVLSTLQELENAGCRAAFVPTVGIDEATSAAIAAFASTSTMLVHGPNCMGLIDVSNGTPVWIEEGNLEVVPRGGISLIAQSGSAAIFVTRTAAPDGFSKIVSTGSELGVSTAHYLAWLAQDPDTTVIGLVLESIGDVEEFIEAIALARDNGKPVVALKVGRTDAGARATTAHTGAMLADDDAYQALFDRLDVPLVDDYDELASSLQLLSRLEDNGLRGRRVGVITLSGGQAALTADQAEQAGVELPSFAPETLARLRKVLPDIALNNPLDVGGSMVADESDYATAMKILREAPELDATIVLIDAQTTLSQVEIEYTDDYFAHAIAVAAEPAHNPLILASSSAVSVHERRLSSLPEDVPLLRGIRNSMVAVRAAAANALPITSPERPDELPDADELARLRAVMASVPVIDSTLTRSVLSAYGIPVVDAARVRTLEEATLWVASASYPVVLKVDSSDVPHRSDVGGVVLGIRSDEELAQALKAIETSVNAHLPNARIEGYEIQEQIIDAAEGFAGYVVDSRLGATIGFGSGGTLVELLNDAARLRAPFDAVDAAAALQTTRLATLLGGYRNLLPATPTAPLADLISRLSWLAMDFAGVLNEADLNPVLIEPTTGRVRVVDGLLVRAPSQTLIDAGTQMADKAISMVSN